LFPLLPPHQKNQCNRYTLPPGFSFLPQQKPRLVEPSHSWFPLLPPQQKPMQQVHSPSWSLFLIPTKDRASGTLSFLVSLASTPPKNQCNRYTLPPGFSFLSLQKTGLVGPSPSWFLLLPPHQKTSATSTLFLLVSLSYPYQSRGKWDPLPPGFSCFRSTKKPVQQVHSPSWFLFLTPTKAWASGTLSILVWIPTPPPPKKKNTATGTFSFLPGPMILSPS
jgi:hypothetical protein